MGSWNAPKAHELRKVVQRLAARSGFHVGRMPPNRFEATESVLTDLRRRAFSPGIVVDAGANVGDWTRYARTVFPAATFHMVEPQPGCRAALEALEQSDPRVHLHPLALTRPEVRDVWMTGAGSTGAWIDPKDQVGDGIHVAASTFDELFGSHLTKDKRPLVKLDIEGHELNALAGASVSLQSIEVIIAEVQFYDIERAGLPVFGDVVNFLAERGFEIFDVVSLGSRRRDGRLRIGDVVWVRRDSALAADVSWA
jgi:FkbM family methyltransferase